MIPTRAWVSANRARSDATRNVHWSAISNPPVAATPLMAPMTGFSITGRKRNRPLVSRPGPCPSGRASTEGGASPVSSLRSTPAEKAGSEPVRITASTSGSLPAVPIASHNAYMSARFSALRASGRFRVSVAIRSSTSTITSGSSSTGHLHQRCLQPSEDTARMMDGDQGHGVSALDDRRGHGIIPDLGKSLFGKAPYAVDGLAPPLPRLDQNPAHPGVGEALELVELG